MVESRETFNFSMVPKQVKVIPAFEERKMMGKDYVLFGANNLFPQYLWLLYLKSAVLQSIINGTVEFVSGNDIKAAKGLKQFAKKVNKNRETLQDIILKITLDYFIFGGFALQIIYNAKGQINELYWLDFQCVRSNEDGSKLFYNENWKRNFKEETQEFRAFDPDNKKGTCIFYYKGNKSRGVYPIPVYCGALTAIETSTEISKFHLNNILNNLESSAIISFNNGVPTVEEQEKIERKIKEKFSGADNAGKFIITFNDTKDNAVSVERLSEDNFDKKFDALRSSTMQEIFIGFRAIPTLFGFLLDGQIFSKQGFLESFDLYHRNVVYPTQLMLIRVFDTIFDMDNSIKFEKYTLLDDGSKKTETKENEQPVEEDNQEND